MQSLQLTREVLDEHEQLEIATQGLQEQIHAGLQKIEHLKKEIREKGRDSTKQRFHL